MGRARVYLTEDSIKIVEDNFVDITWAKNEKSITKKINRIIKEIPKIIKDYYKITDYSSSSLKRQQKLLNNFHEKEIKINNLKNEIQELKNEIQELENEIKKRKEKGKLLIKIALLCLWVEQ